MRAERIFLLICFLVAFPVATPAQTPPPAGVAGADDPASARTSAEFIFVHRAELGLSEPQVAELIAIEKRLEARNALLRDELHSFGQAGPVGARGQAQHRGPEADVQRLVRAIESNVEAAEREIGKMLTSEQRQMLRSLREKGGPAVPH